MSTPPNPTIDHYLPEKIAIVGLITTIIGASLLKQAPHAAPLIGAGIGLLIGSLRANHYLITTNEY